MPRLELVQGDITAEDRLTRSEPARSPFACFDQPTRDAYERELGDG